MHCHVSFRAKFFTMGPSERDRRMMEAVFLVVVTMATIYVFDWGIARSAN